MHAHLLLVAKKNELVITSTDREIEAVTTIPELAIEEPGEATISGAKLLDICLNLPPEAELSIAHDDPMIKVAWDRYHARLVTLAPADFPSIEPDDDAPLTLELSGDALNRMFRATAFAMARGEGKYYFNGLLLDIAGSQVRQVATNGYRLATSYTDYGAAADARQVVIPAKAVAELMRLIKDAGEATVKVQLSPKQMQVHYGATRLITHLIPAAEFPDYTRALPTGQNQVLALDREHLVAGLRRIASIFLEERARNVRLSFGAGGLSMHAKNEAQDEAEENMEIDYQGADMTVQYNVDYLIDTLSVMTGDKVTWTIRDPAKACQLEDVADPQSLFLITPLRETS